MSIEVRIPIPPNDSNEIRHSARATKELKARGVPIGTFLSPMQVDRGALVIRDDQMFGERVFTWFDEGEEVRL